MLLTYLHTHAAYEAGDPTPMYRILAEYTPMKDLTLYEELGPSEERHAALYVELASREAPEAEVLARLAELAAREAEIVGTPVEPSAGSGTALRLHAG